MKIGLTISYCLWKLDYFSWKNWLLAAQKESQADKTILVIMVLGLQIGVSVEWNYRATVAYGKFRKFLKEEI